jgi:hypothetical protein
MSRYIRGLLLAFGALVLTSTVAAAQGPEEQACQSGDNQACFQIAMRHLGNMDNAPGMQRSIPYFTKACNGGVAKACFALGGIYQTQETTGLGPNDLVLAKSWFQKACAGGFQPGCKRVAELDDPNFTRTARRATPEEEASCARGNAEDCWTVALAIAGDGTPEHIRQAAPALETACNGNIGQACLTLGVSYQEGSGVPQDLGRAMSLLTKGCDLGVTYACQKRDGLSGTASTPITAATTVVPAAPAPAPAPAPPPAPTASADPSFEGVRIGMSQDGVRSALGNPLGKSPSSSGGETWAYRGRTLGVTFDAKGSVSGLLAISRDAGAFEGVRVNDDLSKIKDLSNKRGWKLDDYGTMLLVSGGRWSLLINSDGKKISMITLTAVEN